MLFSRRRSSPQPEEQRLPDEINDEIAHAPALCRRRIRQTIYFIEGFFLEPNV
jgi:hypothetical protein